jgi:segregation and condensation protein B
MMLEPPAPPHPIMAPKKTSQPAAGFHAPPADGGLSIDRLAQAFAAMMGTGDPYAAGQTPPGDALVQVDASPDLDDAVAADGDAASRVSPTTIVEAILFVGMPGGEPLSSRRIAGLMRGVRPQEVDEIVEELRRRSIADNCPYEIAAKDSGWVMRLRPEFASFGAVLETRARLVRLDPESLDALAAIAWNQPVSRDRLVELGCDASPSVLRTLVRRGLLQLEQPQDKTAGSEPCYRTTRRFLDVFKLESLDDLPNPSEPPR